MRRLRPLLWIALWAWALSPAPAADLRFVLLGDRTGEAQAGVWEAVWRGIAIEKPDFVVGVGDTIQGGNDTTAAGEWRRARLELAPYARMPLYLAAGNHDIWSDASATLFREFTGRPLHYGFDRGPIHFTVLDNSLDEQFSPAELAFLESDLRAHQAQPVKFIVSHRPSWLLDAGLGNRAFEVHRLARRYGVQFVVAGHVHQLLHATLEQVSYVCLPSAGGHLRLSEQYADGWLFGYTLVTVRGTEVEVEIKELPAPRGRGRVTHLADWGLTGLKVR